MFSVIIKSKLYINERRIVIQLPQLFKHREIIFVIQVLIPWNETVFSCIKIENGLTNFFDGNNGTRHGDISVCIIFRLFIYQLCIMSRKLLVANVIFIYMYMCRPKYRGYHLLNVCR